MTAVLRLQHEEPLELDRSQLKVLYQSLGAGGADKVVARALDELTAMLGVAGGQYMAGEIGALRGSLKTIITLAQQVGMPLLARVGRDVLALSHTFDAAAFGATMARLERIGESSLIAVWDLQDMSV